MVNSLFILWVFFMVLQFVLSLVLVPVGGLFPSLPCSVRCLVLFGGLFCSVHCSLRWHFCRRLHPTGACAVPTAPAVLQPQWSYSRRRSIKKSVQRYEKKLTYANFSAFLSSICPSHRNPLIPLYSQNQTNETESRQNRARVSPRFCRVLIEPATTNGNNQRPW